MDKTVWLARILSMGASWKPEPDWRFLSTRLPWHSSAPASRSVSPAQEGLTEVVPTSPTCSSRSAT